MILKILYIIETLWRLTQVVRDWSAKPLCIGSIPIDAFAKWMLHQLEHLFFAFRNVRAKLHSVYIYSPVINLFGAGVFFAFSKLAGDVCNLAIN